MEDPNAIDIRPLGAETIYAVDDPDCCYFIDEASELLDDFGSYSSPGEPRHVGLTRNVADLWIINIPTVFDDDGWVEESELRYFRNEAEARAAYAKAIEARRAAAENTDAVHESAVPKGFAQIPSDEGGE